MPDHIEAAMIQRRYHIRDRAKTTAGGTVRASATWYTVDGTPIAREGDPVDCPACGTEGIIQCVQPRMPNHLDGKEFALSDDLCICGCSPAPKLIAEQTVKYQLLALVPDEVVRRSSSPAARQATHLIYDEQLRLVAPPIEGVPYFIETRDGRSLSGRTGPGGLLPRIDTPGEDEYTVLWGDEALAKMIEGQPNG
jgi:uncharacterized Zn-binding protein involved in type VI secretion